MASTYSILSLNVHAWFYQRFETIAILWDRQNSKFLHISKNRRLILWTISTLLSPIFSNGCCIYLIGKELLSSQRLYGLEFLLVQLTFITVGGFWLVIFIAANLFGDTFVCAWNAVRKILLNARKKFDGKFTF